jgi:hypothetical protein
VGVGGVCVGSCVWVGYVVDVAAGRVCIGVVGGMTLVLVGVGGWPVREVNTRPATPPKTSNTASPNTPRMIHRFLDTLASCAVRCPGCTAVLQWVDEAGESKSVDYTTDGKASQHTFLPTTRGLAVQDADELEGCAASGNPWRALTENVRSAQATSNVAQDCPPGVDTDSELCYPVYEL